ncbi:MAG TPA: hypothetical protein VMK84_03645, partial [Streptosporangiaceae bacterium]|nr:hypothetical protein [Streptosporangiaceae bacterium]
VGKSALAVHFAHKIKTAYRHAQLFVSLSDVKPGPGGPYAQNADERLILQPDFVTCGEQALDAERPPLDDHGL